VVVVSSVLLSLLLVAAQGFVANEVETEQIVDAGIDWSTGHPLWSSMVQVRRGLAGGRGGGGGIAAAAEAPCRHLQHPMRAGSHQSELS
jgi:hypothetical protein